MIHAKNYETASTFVKVIQRKPLAFFSGHGVYTYKHFHCEPHHISDSVTCRHVTPNYVRAVTLMAGVNHVL